MNTSTEPQVKPATDLQEEDESLFVDEEVIEAKVLVFGKEKTFHFRQLPAVTVQTYALVEATGTPEQIALQMVKIVQQSLCSVDGELVLTMTQALKLKSKALAPLFYKALQVAAGIKPGSPEEKAKPAKK